MVYKKKAEKRIRIPENLKTPFSQMSPTRLTFERPMSQKPLSALSLTRCFPPRHFRGTGCSTSTAVVVCLRASRTFCVRTSLARREPSPTAAISHCRVRFRANPREAL